MDLQIVIKTQNSHQNKQDNFNDFNPNPNKNIVGAGIFFNSTRSQVRDLTKQSC